MVGRFEGGVLHFYKKQVHGFYATDPQSRSNQISAESCKTQGCKWSQKKKRRKSTTRQWNLKIMQPSLQYLIVCPYYKHFWLLAVLNLPTILAFYKSGWQCLLGAGRDLFLTTLAKGSRAVSESECTWLSIIISQMLWLLMHCLVFRYSRKFGQGDFVNYASFWQQSACDPTQFTRNQEI